MSEEQIKASIRGFLKSMIAPDIKQSMSYLTPDATWVTQFGTFKGSAEIEKYLIWMGKAASDAKVTETGVGIVVQGNTGIIEHDLSGKTNGKNWVMPAMCVYEFKDDKISKLRTFSDSLTMAQHATGGFSRWIFNMVSNGMKKGL
jgi:ketosteroid isomerase-like protein